MGRVNKVKKYNEINVSNIKKMCSTTEDLLDNIFEGLSDEERTQKI